MEPKIERVIKRDGTQEKFVFKKISSAVNRACKSCKVTPKEEKLEELKNEFSKLEVEIITVDKIHEIVGEFLDKYDPNVAKKYVANRKDHTKTKDFVKRKIGFINKYKKTDNTANSTVDDNSNVGSRNIGVLNAEIHKEDNIDVSRAMIMSKLEELFPDFDPKQYVEDLESHIIYKNDESSFCGAISPYCVSMTMYPFLTDGIYKIGGLSARPKNLDSFCGMFINLIFATSAQFAGAVACPEALLYFDHFSKKEWGDDYYLRSDEVISSSACKRERTIKEQIHQYFQQIVYSINQPAAARGMQSAFVNFGYFDKPFFENMFGEFYFPDGTQPTWESLCWLQKEFMMWFNEERNKCILTFPVESFALIYKDGKFLDEDSANFVAEEYSRGHSFFTYISDTADSLSSCCFTKDTKVLWKSSTLGVNLTTLEELHNLNWEPSKKNLRIFHNGSWVKGKSIKLPLEGRKVYKVVTYNNKEFFMSDNHINVTLSGEKETKDLTTEDYLMFNTQPLNEVPEKNQGLTYEMGFVIGAFLGDGSFGPEINGKIYDINFSQNETKYLECIKNLNKCAYQLGLDSVAKLSAVYNNVYPVRISSRDLVEFICNWTNWERGIHAESKRLNLNCLLQSLEFRKGILDGWYNTDGGNSNRCYTTSSGLSEDMETLITSLGLCSIINVSDRTDETVVIRGEEFKRNFPLYCVRWYENGNHRKNKDSENSWIKRNNSIYFKIKSIEEVDNYSDELYCIECENKEEPYFTLPSGLITHNCRLKNKIQTKEFNYTNGNMGVQTGSKSVITLNLSRITQDWVRETGGSKEDLTGLGERINTILSRVYKYHIAYNELLWEMYDCGLLPVYKAGFISLNKQYLTIGLNALNQAAEFLGIKCNVNDDYKNFCQFIFGTIKESNTKASGKYFGHKITLNTECIPAESLAIKNYNWDKEDGYWVPKDTNLYASYIYKPNDKTISILDKLILHGKDYIGDYLDGGSAAHINIDHHFSKEQYDKLLKFAAENGCQYFTFNCVNSECTDCGYISKEPFKVCPKCGGTHIDNYDRIIGYLTKIKNWSSGRQIEQKTRIYSDKID